MFILRSFFAQAVPVEKSYAPEEPHKERKTLLRAAFVNKKHRVQYEMCTFYHFLTLKVGLQRKILKIGLSLFV